MTQTLQQALLKAGIITQEKLKKAEQDKKYQNRPAPRQAPKPVAPPARPQTSASAPARKPIAAKPAAPRPAPQNKSVGFIERKHHHHIRTDCDACGKSSPDVEYYQHRNKSLDKYWLCVRCADDYSVSDEFRQTKQSQHAISGLFRRQYGATKVFR